MPKVKEKSYLGWGICSDCNTMFHSSEMKNGLQICPSCGFHFALSTKKRLELLCDKGSFEPLFEEVVPEDILGFEDKTSYKKRLQSAEKKTGEKSAVKVGRAQIFGEDIALGVLDFSFMGGSMGRCEGEKITRLIEYATHHKLPLVMVNASGGARMQESTYSLMQMAKTSAAVKKHQQEGLFYLSVLTNPTMGGVLASFAFLADIVLAEPKALIGFAGPRVIEQTIGEKLKATDQKSEFQLENGMIDQIVHRKDLKNKIAYFITIFR